MYLKYRIVESYMNKSCGMQTKSQGCTLFVVLHCLSFWASIILLHWVWGIFCEMCTAFFLAGIWQVLLMLISKSNWTNKLFPHCHISALFPCLPMFYLPFAFVVFHSWRKPKLVDARNELYSQAFYSCFAMSPIHLQTLVLWPQMYLDYASQI